MAKLYKRTSALLFLALLTGCGPNTAGIVDTSLLCPGWQEITVSKDDKFTEKTARKIEGNNEARLSAGCPADPERTDAARKSKSAPKEKPVVTERAVS